MTTDASPPPREEDPDAGAAGTAARAAGEFADVQASPQFGELRRAHRSFAFPLTVAFVLWYLAYVLLSNYAGGFMGTRIGGSNINVALLLGLAQFVTTFLIAWWYARRAGATLDPKAQAIKDRLEEDA